MEIIINENIKQYKYFNKFSFLFKFRKNLSKLLH